MLSGEAVVAIWNDISDEGRDEFYAWHLHEHMPERAGIPGFRRGRRYVAAAPDAHPEFFTLYEADTMQVLQGSDYLGRLNAPTAWTRRVTAGFRNTSRGIARVLGSFGPGSGGFILTVRFSAGSESAEALTTLVRGASAGARVTGAHLCAADEDSSRQKTAETQGRSDLQVPPSWFAMVEATDGSALGAILPEAALREAGAFGPLTRGVYRLEYTRTKTAFAAG